MTTYEDQLRGRVEAKCKRLEARLLEAKADSSQQAKDTVQSIETQLAEVRGRVADGYASLDADSVRKLNDWLDSEPKQHPRGSDAPSSKPSL